MNREEAINFLECRRAYYASLSTDPNSNVKATKVCGYTLAESANACLMAIETLRQEPCEDMGEVSDGYHTFNQLYYQRAVLFATIVNLNKDKAWKSFKHFDGNYCFDSNGEWFIVGVDTSQGSYTYHYEKKYWDMFDCEELEYGKEWDGHTEEDVTRLLSLQQQLCIDAISRQAVLDMMQMRIGGKELYKAVYDLPSVIPQPKTGHWTRVTDKTGHLVWECDCGWQQRFHTNFCPDCGIKMVKPQESEVEE